MLGFSLLITLVHRPLVRRIHHAGVLIVRRRVGNAGVLQFFGNNDLTTLEWTSKRLGATTLACIHRRRSRNQGACTRTLPVFELS